MRNLLYALTFAFILMKVTGYIDWSWWLVLSPLIAAIVLWIGIVCLYAWSQIIDERNKSVSQFNSQRKSRFQDRLDEYMKQSKLN